MFLKGLTDTQQKLFLGLARELIEADQKISEHEKIMINVLCQEMGQQELIAGASDEVLREFFPDKASRAAVMLELIGLGACDGDFAPEEAEIINRLRKIWGLSESTLQAYQAWVRKLYEVYGEAAAFMR